MGDSMVLLLLRSAFAFTSETQPVVFEDTADVFQSAEFSTGYVPSGSPLAVQFAIVSEGGATAIMEGDADLSWPQAFRFDLTGAPGGGLLALETSIDAVTTIQIDLSDWGYKGVFELDRRSLPLDGRMTFDPFLLDGSGETRAELIDQGNPNELIYYSFEIIAGLSLDLAASVRTEARVGLEAIDVAANDGSLSQEGAAALMEPEAVADYAVQSIFNAAWDAGLDLVFTPSAEACSAFGCVTLLEIDIPVTLLDDAFEQAFPPAQQIFPLPLLDIDPTQGAVGDVDIGHLSNLEITLQNLGSLPLAGTVTIEGSSDFTVFPADFTAAPGGVDGFVVTFQPTVEGPQEAFLLLDSNDPTQPQVVLTLSANGELVDEGQDVEETESKAVSTCGCASGSPPAAPWLVVGLAALALGRRRR